MNMNEQAPECCPFCGAARKPHCNFIWFECGTMTAPADNNRRDQTPACATAERERLTRERDDWKRCAEELNAFMERARSKTHHSRESLQCLRQFDALKAKEAKS